MKKAILAMALAALIPATAWAEPRLDTLKISCEAAQAFVNKNGAALLYSGPYVYDRYVSDRRYCTPNQEARAARLTDAHETPRCIINYRCLDQEFRLNRTEF